MTRIGRNKVAGAAMGLGLVLYSTAASADEGGGLSGAGTAWILTTTPLVLFITLPGLALFYGGLVRAQAVLSVLMHCFTICCIASLLWLAGVYSLAFGDGGALDPVIGGLGKAFLVGIGAVVVWSGVVTFAIVKIISEEDEIEGLDIVAHGERAYVLQTLAR